MLLSWLTKVVIFSGICLRAAAIQSDTCWDGSNPLDYTGTISVTLSGLTCQSWADSSPHSHVFHDSWNFPYDGSDVAALNYCRGPDGTSGPYGPFCFTMDPGVRWEFCNIPRCYNLACSNDTVVGQSDPSAFTDFLDTYTGTNYLEKENSPYGFTCCGTIKQWRVYIENSGTIRFQVWRLENGTGNYVLRGENVYSYANGDRFSQHNEIVPQSQRITVQEGDLIGWYMSGSDMVTFNAGSTPQVALLSTSAPSLGDSVDFSGAAIGNSRDYAIGAEVTPGLAPYFVNTVASITVSASELVGNTVHTLTVSDDDLDDISTLTVSIATNTYFDTSGTDVIVKSSLDIGTESLVFTVTDQCSLFTTYNLSVTITPEPVTMTSLPVTANVSESETNETLVHTLTITPAGTYTCTLDAYDPTRPEGNPFIVKNTPTLDIGVYLKDTSGISYNVATSYNVTVTCTNADPSSGTSYIIINVDPNSQPVFTSFLSSATFDVFTTSINDIIYTATVADAEGDPITMSLVCDPAGGPFAINNNGEIRITSDPSLLTQNAYTFILTADDSFNTVTSSNVSVTVTNVNVKPVITNLPAPTQTVLENQAAGVLVFQVSQSDANGDTPTFSATFSSIACAGMYNVNSTDGSVTTLASFDYENDTSCTLNITVSDGVATSDPETLTIDVGDEDESPIFSSSAYVITTEEVADGTALPDVGIAATDPEGTAVSLTMSCPYVDIDSASGIVTMTTNYDIETSPSNPYTIACIVTATDATSQTSTATLDVIVSDGNDNVPVFTQTTYTSYIAQGHTGYGIINTVTATDADKTSPNNVITYSMTPTTTFSIGGSGGIQNIVDLSGDTAGTTYTLTVTATDGGIPSLSSTATVIISVLTTTTTTAMATTTSGSDGFFSDTTNLVFFALVAFTAVLMSVLIALLIWRFCCKQRLMGNKSLISRISPKENNLRDSFKGHRVSSSTNNSSSLSSRIGSPARHNDVHINHISENSPRYKGENYKYPQKFNGTHANGHIGRIDPYSASEAPHPRPEIRKSPGCERRDSGNSYISVSSIPNRVSAVQSIRRTTGLSDAVDSPRSVSKPNTRDGCVNVPFDPNQASAVQSIKRTNCLSDVSLQRSFSKPNRRDVYKDVSLIPRRVPTVQSVTGISDSIDTPRLGMEDNNVSVSPKPISAVESVKRTTFLSDAVDSPRSVSNLAVCMPNKQTAI